MSKPSTLNGRCREWSRNATSGRRNTRHVHGLSDLPHSNSLTRHHRLPRPSIASQRPSWTIWSPTWRVFELPLPSSRYAYNVVRSRGAYPHATCPYRFLRSLVWVLISTSTSSTYCTIYSSKSQFQHGHLPFPRRFEHLSIQAWTRQAVETALVLRHNKRALQDGPGHGGAIS